MEFKSSSTFQIARFLVPPSVWKFYRHVVIFLWHLDVEKLRYRAKSDSTFVVSVVKWASNKERTSSFVLNIYRKKFMATIVYPVAAFTSGLNVFKRDGRLWKTVNVRTGQEMLWTKKTRKLCLNSSEKSRN